MIRRRQILRSLSPLLILLASCSHGLPEPAQTAPVALVDLQPATRHSISDRLVAYGTAEFPPTDAQTLSVQVESEVAAVLVNAGAAVRRGQPLLRLVPSAATRLELDAADRAETLTATERQRQQRLRDEGLATESDWLAAVDAARTAAQLHASLAERVGHGGARTLTAPRDGIVDELVVRPGDVLAPGAVALRLASGDALQVRLGVEPEDASRVSAGQRVWLVALAGGEPIAVRIDGLDRRVDPETKLAAAIVRMPASTGLPGAVMRGEIIVAQHDDVIAVPPAALSYEAAAAYLFIAVDGKARRRDVDTGLRDDGLVEITRGLAMGESVIVVGNAALEDGMQIRTDPASAAAQAGDAAP